MRKFPALLLLILLAGCGASGPERTTGEWRWSDPAKGASQEEMDQRLAASRESCRVEARRIPLPPPTCTMTPPADCSELQGFDLEWCQVQQPTRQCDRSPIYAAKEARELAFEKCMNLFGWVRNQPEGS